MFASLYENALLTHAHKVGDLILVRMFYKTRPSPGPSVLIAVLEAYPCTNKHFPRYLSYEISENSYIMADYMIKYASGYDLQQTVNMCASFVAADLLTTIILQHSFGESSNFVESLRALAKHRYEWALSTAAFSSDVLVSHSYYSPHLFEALLGFSSLVLIHPGSFHGKTSQERFKHLQTAPIPIFTNSSRTLCILTETSTSMANATSVRSLSLP